jgi:recombination protein RecR
MHNYPHKVLKLINEISKFPGVGPKMAERIALYMLRRDHVYIDALNVVISGIKSVTTCKKCHTVSDGEICSICADENRDKGLLCVVESPEDVINIERTGKYQGYYFVLQGLINPLENMLPENLKLKELSETVKKEKGISEILLAINHTVEGDATSLYIASIIKEKGSVLRISRLAKGLPTGSDIKYADEITLGQAILERKEI